MGTQLFSNDLIKTGSDGYAIFVFLEDKSMIKVQKNLKTTALLLILTKKKKVLKLIFL